MRVTYIAETDDRGEVAWVWVDSEGQKSVRPFDGKRHKFDRSAAAAYSGAQRDVIEAWLAGQSK